MPQVPDRNLSRTLCRHQGVIPVSYTHLDVYKRQVLRVSIFEYDEEEHMRQEREESRQEGIEQVNDLYDKLHDLNREEDIWKAIKDVEYRKKLLEEFHLD